MTTRSELLGVAARVIGRDGIAGASMRGIAREAGVSLATLQHHFRTKEVLWKAVIDELVVPGERRIADADSTDPVSLFESVVHHRLAGAVEWPGLAGRLLTDASADSEVALDYLVDATSKERAINQQLAAVAIEQGSLRPVDRDALTVLMGIALPALSSSKKAIRKLVGPDLDDDHHRERLATAIADILLYGVLPR